MLAPSLFTLANMACGYYSLMAASRGDFAASATAVLVGIVFDMLDGRVARWVHGESVFGVEFDSLSDFLTFGVAPAYMLYELTLKDYGVWGLPISFSFALCGALRLARFNAVSHSGASSKTHFQGLPIPAGAGFLASFVLLYNILEEQRPAHTLSLVMGGVYTLIDLAPFLVVALALLMISNIPYAAFKQVRLERRSAPLLVTVALFLTLMYFYPQNAIFLICLLYVLSGLLGLARRRKSE